MAQLTISVFTGKNLYHSWIGGQNVIDKYCSNTQTISFKAKNKLKSMLTDQVFLSTKGIAQSHKTSFKSTVIF